MKRLMNKKFTLAFVLLSGLSHQVFAADTSAAIAVNGTVTNADTVSCTVSPDKTSVAIRNNLSELISQTDNIKTGVDITLNVSSGNHSEQSIQCRQLADEGKLDYRFIGTVDDADGISLANADNSIDAAKGVGVGVYTGVSAFNPGQVVRVNKDHIQASSFGNVISLTLVKLTGQQATAGNVRSTLTIEFDRL